MLPAPRLEGAGFACVAFDLDGTIYFGDTLADGATEVLDLLESSGVDVVFFTNNSVKTRADVIAKLARMGLAATRENTYTSGSAVGGYLLESGLDRVAILGSDGLAREIESAGVSVCEIDDGAQALVIGLVTEFDFDRRPEALDVLEASAPIIAANMDMTYPVEGGQLRPGCGAIATAVAEWTGRRIDRVVGKPGTYMLDLLCAERGLDRSDVVIVGDNLDSDIAMALAAGCRSVLLDPSGAAGDIADTHVVRDLHELAELLSREDDRGNGERHQ